MSLAKDFLESLNFFEQEEEQEKCPECGSDEIIKEGNKYNCKSCSYEWIQGSENKDKDNADVSTEKKATEYAG